MKSKNNLNLKKLVCEKSIWNPTITLPVYVNRIDVDIEVEAKEDLSL